MNPRLAGAPGVLRHAQETIQLNGLSPESSLEMLRHVLQLMAQVDWNQSPPGLGKKLRGFLRHRMGNPDPYAAVKERLNQRAGELYPAWHCRFREAYPPREWFTAADLMLARGQGNYESLAGTKEHVFSLLKIKCRVLAEALHCPVGGPVLHHQRPVSESRLIEAAVGL